MERPDWQKILELFLSSNETDWELGYVLFLPLLKGKEDRDLLLSMLFALILFSPKQYLDPSSREVFDKKLRQLLQKEDAYFFRKSDIVQRKMYAITDRHVGAPDVQYAKIMELLTINRFDPAVLPLIFNHGLVHSSGQYLQLAQWQLTYLLLNNQLGMDTIDRCMLSTFSRQQVVTTVGNSTTQPSKQLNLHCYLPKITRQLEHLLRTNDSITFFKNGLKALPSVVYENPSLVFLYVYGNPIEELETCKAWANLYELQFSFCRQLSIFPQEMTAMNVLKNLTIDHCRLEEIPAAIFQIKQLEKLALSQNKISEIPPVLGELEQLRMLNLNQNLPLRKIPAAVYQLPNLEKLWLKDCAITKIPKQLTTMTQLYDLRLSHNPINQLPADFMNLDKLVHLQLERTKIRCEDAFWETILGLKSLRHLELFGVPVKKSSYLKYKEAIQEKLAWFKLHDYYLY